MRPASPRELLDRTVLSAARRTRVWGLTRDTVKPLEALAVVDQPMRLLRKQLGPKPAAAEYTVQGRRVRIVHGTGDLYIFREIFVRRFYALPPHLPPPRRIADLGGNIGLFTLFASIQWPSAEVVGFEPDPANIEKYRWTVSRNELPAELIEACASAANGEVRFALGEEGGSHITGDESGVTVPAVDVFPYLEDVDLIKMDIEGGEWELMLDPRFASLPARTVIMEYHPHLCPEPDARAAAQSALRAAGFTVEPIHHLDHAGIGMLRAFR